VNQFQQRTPQQASRESRFAREAWENGQPIQWALRGHDEKFTDFASTGESSFPEFGDPALVWRPKPGPSYRPWRGGEIPVGAMIRWKSATEGHHRYLIAYASEKVGIYKSTGLVKYDAYFCLTTCEHSTDYGVTWKPCGILEDQP